MQTKTCSCAQKQPSNDAIKNNSSTGSSDNFTACHISENCARIMFLVHDVQIKIKVFSICTFIFNQENKSHMFVTIMSSLYLECQLHTSEIKLMCCCNLYHINYYTQR